MKKLSIEEKAKRYDEAIERVKVFKEHLLEINEKDYADEMDYIFPELKESEDERIRKRIIHALHGDVLEMSEIKEAVDWLEKQGEQKSAFDIEIPFGRDSELIEETMTIPSGCHAVIENNKVIIRKGEKPTEWSDKDKQIIQALNNCIEELENTNGWNYIYVDGCDDIRIETLKKWLKSLKERFIWKPSDEQMHYLHWIANIKLGDSVVEQEVSKHLNELYKQLKQL